ncbi:MAG TPA: Ig-like domain-containing protein, partial [Vicinamibacterales bacterium]|nr:Ig-like domain-containing protein [Vicinamibacterales bacterium]
TGIDSFGWQVHDGLVDSATATVQILVGSDVVLLLDAFDRPDGPSVGNGWVELETNAGDVGIVSGALQFSVTADRVARPMVRRAFTATAAGVLEWEFTFDWQRTGSEGSYRILMQLGDSTLFQDDAVDQGVGVNLAWTAIGGIHQQLGSRRDGTNTALGVVSGLARIRVSIDLDARTYSVSVDDTMVGEGLPFEDLVGSLDAVRLFTDGMNEQNFAGRRFDDLSIRQLAPGANQPPTANGQNINTATDTAVSVALAYTDPDGPGPYTFTLVSQPLHGTLTPGALNGTFVYTPETGFTGTDSFTWQVHDGLVDSATATVQILIGSNPVLLFDDFDRPDAAGVGNGWVELETNAGDAGVVSGALQFSVTADRAVRPMVRRSFTGTSTGTLEWEFTFDWQRTGTEGIYRLFMQLGDGTLLQDNAVDQGVGVNLVWTGDGGVHQQLGSRRDGTNTPLAVVSGLARIKVSIDLDAHTYTVFLNDVAVGQGLPFEDPVVTLDTVRFFTDGVNHQNFAGRRFDDVAVVRTP